MVIIENKHTENIEKDIQRMNFESKKRIVVLENNGRENKLIHDEQVKDMEQKQELELKKFELEKKRSKRF